VVYEYFDNNKIYFKSLVKVMEELEMFLFSEKVELLPGNYYYSNCSYTGGFTYAKIVVLKILKLIFVFEIYLKNCENHTF